MDCSVGIQLQFAQPKFWVAVTTGRQLWAPRDRTLCNRVSIVLNQHRLLQQSVSGTRRLEWATMRRSATRLLLFAVIACAALLYLGAGYATTSRSPKSDETRTYPPLTKAAYVGNLPMRDAAAGEQGTVDTAASAPAPRQPSLPPDHGEAGPLNGEPRSLPAAPWFGSEAVAPDEPLRAPKRARNVNGALQTNASVDHRTFVTDQRGLGILGEGAVAAGWEKTTTNAEASMVLTHSVLQMRWAALTAAQLPNHLRNEKLLCNKAGLWEYLAAFEAKEQGITTSFYPETYNLRYTTSRSAFTRRADAQLAQLAAPQPGGGGDDDDALPEPWVVKQAHIDGGEGIDFLTTVGALRKFVRSLNQTGNAARSAQPRRTLSSAPKKRARLVQRYLKEIMLLPDNRKFDLRVFWTVVCIDPVVVLYAGFYVRVTAAAEGSGFTREAHLTNIHIQASQTTIQGVDPEELRMDSEQLGDVLRAAHPEVNDPLAFVNCGIKRALAIVFESARDHLIDKHEVTTNAFTLMAADFMIDNNLGVWLTEVQADPGVAPPGTSSRKMWTAMSIELMAIVDEVRRKRLMGESVLPLENQRSFETIVQGGSWQYPLPTCSKAG